MMMSMMKINLHTLILLITAAESRALIMDLKYSFSKPNLTNADVTGL